MSTLPESHPADPVRRHRRRAMGNAVHPSGPWRLSKNANPDWSPTLHVLAAELRTGLNRLRAQEKLATSLPSGSVLQELAIFRIAHLNVDIQVICDLIDKENALARQAGDTP